MLPDPFPVLAVRLGKGSGYVRLYSRYR